MGIPKTMTTDRFTYGLYKTWPEDERWELIDGEAWDMCAAPNTEHQRLSMELTGQVYAFLKGKPCRAFAAPFDVLLPSEPDQADDEVGTVVQPDLSVFCDRGKITHAGARGAPDLVVEILSPWTMRKDFNEKLRLYERVGVSEYWVVDPLAKLVQAWRQEPDAATRRRFGAVDIVQAPNSLASTVLLGLDIDLGELFTSQ